MVWAYRHTVLALCTVAFFATMVARLAISPVVPAINAEFAVSNTVIGVALSGMWLAYALSQFPSGVLGDRYGERAIILVAVGGTAVTSLLLALSPVFAAFVLFAVLLGGVAGLHYSVATALLTRTHDDIGTAIGIHTIGSPAAGLVAPIAAAWVGSQYGWRPAVAVGALVAVPVFALFALRVRPTEPRRPTQPMRERFDLAPVLSLLARPPILFTLLMATVGAFVWQSVASFLPTFLIEHRGQSATLAGVVFSAYFVVQGVVKVGVGAASDRYGREAATAGCMIAAAVGTVAFVAAPGLVGITLAVVLLGIGMSWAAAVEPRFIDYLTEEERSTGFGLVRTVYLVLGALGPVVVGLLADLAGWAVSFGALTGLLVLVFVLILLNRAFDLGY